MAVDPMVSQLQNEVETLKRALTRYTSCPHGTVNCSCTQEARAALYPYLEKEAAAFARSKADEKPRTPRA